MTLAPRTIGVVLAGGRSARFGRDKALLVLPDRPGLTLTARALEVLEPWCDARVVVRGGVPIPLPDGVQQLDEPVAFGGPGRALAAALPRLAAERFLLAPCDMPRLHAALYGRLLEAVDPAGAGACFESGRGLEPLVAVLTAKGARGFVRLVDAGVDAPHLAMAELGVERIPVPAQERDAFLNVNRTEDWLRLQALLEAAP